MVAQRPPVLLKAPLDKQQLGPTYLQQRIQNALEYQQTVLTRTAIRMPGNVVGPVNNGPLIIQGRRPNRIQGSSPIPLSTPWDSQSPQRENLNKRFRSKTASRTDTKRRRRNGQRTISYLYPTDYAKRKGRKYGKLHSFQY